MILQRLRLLEHSYELQNKLRMASFDWIEWQDNKTKKRQQIHLILDDNSSTKKCKKPRLNILFSPILPAVQITFLSISQCAKRTLNIIANPFKKNYAEWESLIQGLQIYFTWDPRLKGI